MSKRLFGAVLLGFCLLAFGLVGTSVLAQGINRQVSYQGKLLDSTGVAVPDGTYQMKFSLYSAPSSGVTLWSASGTTATPTAIPVTVQGGLFSIMLGDPSASGGWQNTLDGVNWNSDAIYLGVTIGSDSEMSPRKRLGAVPQAFNAEQLQGMYASSSASGGQSLFTIHQTENNAATSTRSALEIRTDGSSAANDLLIRGVDGGPNVTTFAVNRLGSVTSNGQFTFFGDGTSTISGSLSVQGNVSSTHALTGDLVVVGATTLGRSYADFVNLNASINGALMPSNYGVLPIGDPNMPWGIGYFVGVSSTNATSTYSYTQQQQFGGASGTSMQASFYTSSFTTSSISSLGFSAVPGSGDLRMDVQWPYAYVLDTTNNLLRSFDVSREGAPVALSSLSIGGGATAIRVSGNYAYVLSAGGLGGSFRVFDVSNPGDMSLVGSIGGLGSGLAALEVDGSTAYFSDTAFLRSVNIADPSSPKLLASVMISGGGNSILDIHARADGYVYVSVPDDNAIYVVRKTDPAHLTVASTISVSYPGYLASRGGYLFSTHRGAGYIYKIDVSHPLVPGAASSMVALDDTPSELFVSGRYLFVSLASGLGGFAVVDTLDPADPSIRRLVTTINAAYYGGAIRVNGSHLIIVSSAGNALLTNYRLPGADLASVQADALLGGTLVVQQDGQVGRNLTVDNTLVVGSGGVRSSGALNVGATSTSSTIMGNLFVGTSTLDVAMHPSFVMNGDDLFVQGNIGSATSVYTNGSFIAGTGSTYYNASSLVNTTGSYTASSTQDFTIAANDGISLRAGLGVNIVSGSSDIGLLSGSGFVIGSADGATSLGSAANRFNAQFLNTTTTHATTTYLYATSLTAGSVSATRARVSEGLYADLVDASSMASLGSVAVGASPGAVAVDDRYAYTMNTSTNQIKAFYMATSTPFGAFGVSTYTSPPLKMEVHNGTLYSVHEDGTLHVNPYAVGDASVAVGGMPTGLAVQGRYVYVTTRSPNQLVTVEVSDAGIPTVVSTLVDGTYLSDPKAVFVQDKFLYVLNESGSGLSSFFVGDPAQPNALAHTALFIANPKDFVIQGGYAYVIGSSALTTARVSDPSILVASSGSVSLFEPRSLLLVGGRELFVTTGAGVNAFDVSDPDSINSLGMITIPSGNPIGLAVRGRALYVTDAEPNNRLRVYQLPGVEASGAQFGSAEVGTLQVLSDGRVGHNLDVHGALQVGKGGLTSIGALAVQSSNATSVILGNLAIGTSTMSNVMHPSFSMNGDDLFVGGNIGSASSVYTNGAFIAGTGSTYYAAGSITNTSGDFSVTTTGVFAVEANTDVTLHAGGSLALASGATGKFYLNPGSGFVTTAMADGAVSLGSSSKRFNGEFLNTTTTNATTTNFAFEHASGTSLVFGSATGSTLAMNGSVGVYIDASSPITELPVTVHGIGGGDAGVPTSTSHLIHQGEFMFGLNTSTNEVIMYDVSSSTNPAFIAFTLPTGGITPQGLAREGNYLYVVSANGKLSIINWLTNTIESQLTLPDALNGIVLEGHYAYITANHHIYAVDVASVTNPRVISQVTDAAASFRSPSVWRKNLFVFDNDEIITPPSNLRSFDITNPYDLTVMWTLNNIGGIASTVRGSHLFSVDGNGLNIFDVLFTQSVTLSGSIGAAGARDVTLAGNLAYVVTDAGVSIFDVSDVTQPTLLRSIAISDAESVLVDGDTLFVGRQVTSGNSLVAYKLPGIETATLRAHSSDLGTLEVRTDGTIGNNLYVAHALSVGSEGITTRGTIAAGAQSTTSTILGNLMVGTSSIDVLTHAGFALTGQDMFVGGSIGSASSVYTNGSFIAGTGSTYYNAASIVNTTGNYVVTSTGDVVINANGQLSISAPAGIIPMIDTMPLGGSSNRFDAYLRYATTTALDVKTSINQKISSETNWSVKSTFGTGSGVVANQVVGDYSYLVTGKDLAIFNVQNPSSPIRVSSLTNIGSGIKAIAIFGDRAYITSNVTNQVLVVNVANPASPYVENTLTDVTSPTAIKIQGRYAYVTGSSGFHVFDLGYATGPHAIAHLFSGNTTRDVAIMGKYAYLTMGVKVQVVDISDPYSPQAVSFYVSSGSPGTIVAQGGYLYVGDTAVSSFDVLTATTTPSYVTTKVTGGIVSLPNGLALQGNYLYVAAAGYEFLDAFDVSSPSGPVGVKSLSLGGSGVATQASVQVVGHYAYVGSQTFDKYVSIVDLGGVQAANLRAESLQAGDLSVLGDGRIAGSLSLQHGLNVGQGILAYGASAFAASSTGPSAQFVNRASHTVYNNSWGAYVDRLLVGDDASATGTDGYSQVITYDSGSKHVGLCLKRLTTGGCPDANGLPITSIVADDAISASAFDLAETYAPLGDVTSTDVLVFGSVSTTTMRSPGVAYDPTIMGIASTRPGFVLGSIAGVQVALAGRVPTKVSTVNGAIAIGDPLTTSQYPGVAMKATKPGMIVGYALDAATATSTIEVFVKPGYSAGTILNTDGTVARLSDDLVVDARTTATEHAPTADSWGLTFRGSAWNDGVVTQPSFSLITNVVTPTSSAFVIRNASSTNVFAIDQTGNTMIAGDLVVGGRLYPSGRGAAQNSKYIFLDDTSTSTQYMATNADGWQANDSYDFAERYYSPDALDTGDLVIASDRGQFHVQRSLNESGFLMGIVSTRPAFVAGKQGENTYPIALAGRVPTKVSSMNGAIKVGDALAPSTIPGTAVKATKAGPIVGLALEAYDAATVGKIEVFVNPGWWGGPEAATSSVATTATTAPSVTTPAPTTVNADGSVAYRGFASIATGSKRVHVAYDSVLSYPNIQVTPRGQVRGGWWTDNYTDIGFDIFMNDIQTRDVTFAWSVEGTPTGARIYNSDGTFALVNPTTGEALVQTVATSTQDVAPPIVTTPEPTPAPAPVPAPVVTPPTSEATTTPPVVTTPAPDVTTSTVDVPAPTPAPAPVVTPPTSETSVPSSDTASTTGL